jgi:hypothetical protein
MPPYATGGLWPEAPCMGYKEEMRRIALALAMTLLLGGAAFAKPSNAELLERLLAIAEPDQVEAYHSLHLSSQQLQQLEAVAVEMMPRIEQVKGTPGGQLLLVPEALGKVDSILTPEQRPLARRLIPRAHQWSKLRALYRDYRGS